MAVLPAQDRERVGNHFMRVLLSNLPVVLKPDIRVAVAATDQWIEDNQVAYNSSLPVAFRTNATLVQKTLLFCLVSMRRAGLLRVQED